MNETPFYLAELNEKQRAAVLHDGMPFSILAGTGKPRTSSDGRWRVGDRIFNHDRGYGEVIAIHEGGQDAGPVISVRYENGNL